MDADIRGAFDSINHEFLLKVINNFPGRELIKQWLKAGYMEYGTLSPTASGVPQGGPVSPVLANIALHGMEQALGVKHSSRGEIISPRAVVRFADDFVVFCQTQEDAQTCCQILTQWLSQRGLELSAQKTRIVHLSQGFDFLGFNIRHYKNSQTKTGWKLLIKPSKQAVQALRDRLCDIWHSLQNQSVQTIVSKLNPIIRGWANYYRTGVSRETFHALDGWMFCREVRYAKRKHPNKNQEWKHSRYWGRLNLERRDRWVFGDKDSGIHLLKFSWFSIRRHTLVKGRASPDDPNLRDYWHQRQQVKTKDLVPSRQKLAQRQQGRCPVCGESLLNQEELQIHHKRPKSQGGNDSYSNLELIHLYCHQQLHASSGAVGSE